MTQIFRVTRVFGGVLGVLRFLRTLVRIAIDTLVNADISCAVHTNL
jgi:hypothetical protein